MIPISDLADEQYHEGWYNLAKPPTEDLDGPYGEILLKVGGCVCVCVCVCVVRARARPALPCPAAADWGAGGGSAMGGDLVSRCISRVPRPILLYLFFSSRDPLCPSSPRSSRP